MNRPLHLLAWCALCAVILVACAEDPVAPVLPSNLQGRPTLYYAGALDHTIWRLDPHESDPVELRTEPNASPVGIAVDSIHRRLYWNDQASKSIRSCNLDGSDPLVLAPTVEFVRGMAVDGEGGKLYWCDDGNNANKIQRCNLDGSDVEDLVEYPTNVDLRQIALDLRHGKMYWTLSSDGIIQRANLDGSGIRDVINSTSIAPSGIAVDVSAGKLYWSGYVANKIQRSNLSGTQIEDLVVEGLDSPWTVALDTDRRVLYWIDVGTGKLQRWPTSGGMVEDVLIGLGGDERSMAIGPDLQLRSIGDGAAAMPTLRRLLQKNHAHDSLGLACHEPSQIHTRGSRGSMTIASIPLYRVRTR